MQPKLIEGVLSNLAAEQTNLFPLSSAALEAHIGTHIQYTLVQKNMNKYATYLRFKIHTFIMVGTSKTIRKS